jgi:uncharacterized protein DUF2845
MNKWTLAVVLSLAAASPAFADMRCGSHVITEGDTRSEVVAYCGDPTEVERTTSILRRPVTWINGRPYTVGDGFIEIPVDVWVYNLGPSKLMRRIRFEGGVVVEIETLGYGYYEQNPRPAPRPE